MDTITIFNYDTFSGSYLSYAPAFNWSIDTDNTITGIIVEGRIYEKAGGLSFSEVDSPFEELYQVSFKGVNASKVLFNINNDTVKWSLANHNLLFPSGVADSDKYVYRVSGLPSPTETSTGIIIIDLL